MNCDLKTMDNIDITAWVTDFYARLKKIETSEIAAIEPATIMHELEKVFPELAESEDERIRKELLEEIEFIIPHDDETDSEGLILPSYHARIDRYKSYLEKQKEQKPESCDCSRDEESYTNGIHHVLMNPEAYGLIKLKPAKWSKEFLRLMGITISQDGNQVCMLLGENLAEGIAGFGDTLADAVEEFKKEWRQFDRFRKATWKPSEEQMKALEYFIRSWGESGTMSPQNPTLCAANSLLTDLQKLL